MSPSPPKAPAPPREAVLEAANRAARAIPPLWPLASSVAVNPFLGQSAESLAVAGARLRRAAGISITMPRSWYADQLRSQRINEADLLAAYEAAPPSERPSTLAALRQAANMERSPAQALPTVAELACAEAATDWPGVVQDRISHWASSYFDQGQALWAGAPAPNAYAAWKAVAIHDLTPEIVGLTDFAQSVANLPSDAEDALIACVAQLQLPETALESYFHRLFMTLGGWSQVARYRLWQAELVGGADTSMIDLLAIRAFWDVALLGRYGSSLEHQWRTTSRSFAEPVVVSLDDGIDAILQEATERAAQRRLSVIFNNSAPTLPPESRRPSLQIAFCIDVRSEVFRRALESVDPGIRTLGFAGFFGLGIGHREFASDVLEARLPVLLSPGVFTIAGPASPVADKADLAARIKARAKRAWGRFKLAAISSFAFVEATGPLYVSKLLRDGLGWIRRAAPNDPAPRLIDDLTLQTKQATAASILKAMSLTEGFARLVLLAGHGANVVNNPHASALHCGACGGYSGEVNARLLASLLNDPDVRAGLAEKEIFIPADTLFLAALHDTTTDNVTLYEADHATASHASDLAQAKQWLRAAGALARGERALRLPRAEHSHDVLRRARDWAELRPEWGLAGCQAFVAAPRQQTRGRNLEGRVFLHDYDWRRDSGFGVLELILTAPVVVGSWISLQYYGSTVAPEVFGAGNKLLHNVAGGIGVVEGNGGLLRSGLPWQSIHDGLQWMHEPLRLSVLIGAPREAITHILDRHPDVRALFDNRWLHLFALDDEGRMAWRYISPSRWESCIVEPLPVLA